MLATLFLGSGRSGDTALSKQKSKTRSDRYKFSKYLKKFYEKPSDIQESFPM